MNNATLINQDSGKTEYGTPPDIIERARNTMGRIDLDPASNEFFNKAIEAYSFFDKSCLALDLDWWGNVWMNHPFSRENNPLWINKLVSEYESRNVKKACCITYASTSEKWFRPLLKYPQCFLYGRTKFIGLDGKPKGSATKSCVVTYFGPNPNFFQLNFIEIGAVKVLL